MTAWNAMHRTNSEEKEKQILLWKNFKRLQIANLVAYFYEMDHFLCNFFIAILRVYQFANTEKNHYKTKITFKILKNIFIYYFYSVMQIVLSYHFIVI